MGYPELDKLLPKSQLSSEFIAILNEDSPVDTHALFTLAHILSNLLEQSNSCTLISYRFRKFELESIFTKSGLNRVLLSKLQIFDNLECAVETQNKQENGSSSVSFDVLILDGLSQVLETSESGITEFVNIVLKAQAMSNSVILRTELDRELEEERKIFDWVQKKAEFLMVTKAISFIAKEIHGKLVIRDEKENIYERFYFVKDRSLVLKTVGLN